MHDDLASEELAEEDRVDRALVVEHEDRGPVRPEVLLAAHREVHTGERGPELAPRGDREVHHVAPAPVERTGNRPDRKGRHDARDGERRAHELDEARSAAPGEPVDRPASPGRDRRQAAIRIRRPGTADNLEQWYILVAVG